MAEGITLAGQFSSGYKEGNDILELRTLCVPFSFDLAIYGSVLVCGLMRSQVPQDPNCESCWIRNVKPEERVEKAKI